MKKISKEKSLLFITVLIVFGLLLGLAPVMAAGNSQGKGNEKSQAAKSEKEIAAKARALGINLDKGSERARAIKKGLLEKYEIRDMSIKEKPDGTIWSFSIWGDFAPPGHAKRRAKTDKEYRDLSLAFLKEAEAFFGIKNMNKYLKERKFEKNPKYFASTRILYNVFINGIWLNKIRINTLFDKEGQFTGIDGSLAPVSDEMVSKIEAGGWISMEKAQDIVRKDLASTGLAPLEKVVTRDGDQVAIHEAPYVVWKVFAYKEVVGGRDTENISYIYFVDAFSGEIRDKYVAK